MNSKLMMALFAFLLGSSYCLYLQKHRKQAEGQDTTQIAPKNYIVNGDFEKIQEGSLLYGWQTTEAERNAGNIYNGGWGGKTLVVQLDGNGNSVINQTVTLEEGEYTISLRWALRGGIAVQSAGLSVWWNDQKVVQVFPANNSDYDIHNLTIPVTANQGQNTLSIHGEGISDGNGLTIDDVSLTKNGDQTQHPNLLINGDFSTNTLAGSQWQVVDELEGWQTNEIEVGVGSIYNANWQDTNFVIQLDSQQNSVIKQSLNLTPGEYTISFRYAARTDRVDSSALSVYWNGEQVEQIEGQDDQVHTFSDSVTGIEGQNTLEIRGEGKSDTFGMTVTDVSLTEA